MLLAGDIGGTKTLLQFSEPNAGGLKVCFEKRYSSADFSQFLPMVQAFVQEAARYGAPASAACFGVAGPVSGRTAKTTNLPWTLDADELESVLNIPRVRLINDFQSVGYGIEALQADDIVTLQAGREVPHGPRVVIGAGTGLGHGFLVWQDDHYEVIASEGGHVDFAPTNPLQDELLQYLRGRFGQVSWERVVSGSGLVNLFDFLLATNKGTETAALHATRCTEDPAAAISRFALEGKDALALQALNLFTNLYGAQTGNMALMGLASGGVYVAGGVAPKIIDKIKEGIFMQSFLNKEARIRPVLEAMPVRVVTNAHVGLMGSALVAARLAASSI